MGVPFRRGPHTEWMSEHQLERAYRDRFARQAGEAEPMAALFADVDGSSTLRGACGSSSPAVRRYRQGSFSSH